jgi:hypothetical protein
MRVWNKKGLVGTPPNSVYVGRPSKWGNPFRIGVHGDRSTVIERYRAWLLANPSLRRAVRRELAGKDLVCWCAPLACHADVLMEVANETEVDG